jgi:hypothetical protein
LIVAAVSALAPNAPGLAPTVLADGVGARSIRVPGG